jgi:sRNA-binding carbon storage regulator CsrA
MGSLVLMRRAGEAVIIRDADGKPFGAIAVSSVKGGKVRIAFDVRRGCEIVRAEKAPGVDVNQDGWNQGE